MAADSAGAGVGANAGAAGAGAAGAGAAGAGAAAVGSAVAARNPGIRLASASLTCSARLGVRRSDVRLLTLGAAVTAGRFLRIGRNCSLTETPFAFCRFCSAWSRLMRLGTSSLMSSLSMPSFFERSCDGL